MDAAKWFLDAVVRDVAELPDRTSPEGEPKMMLVTEEELCCILLDKFQHLALLLMAEEIATEEIMDTKGSA